MLFSTIKTRSLEIKNRIVMSPMCMYSAPDGVPQPWHLVHLGSRAVGGAGIVIAEATAISPEGRITPGCTGLWNEDQLKAWAPMARFIREQGAVPAIQLAHAGRKASTNIPWLGRKVLISGNGGWDVVGPSAIPFAEEYPTPRELTQSDLPNLVQQFGDAADRAFLAGFQIVEIHMAHGYLCHSFLSPISNRRTDSYGGSVENRIRFPLEVAQEVRRRWPADLPVWVRISATDWLAGGWDIDQAVFFCKALKEEGIDVIDVSSGGSVKDAKVPIAPHYQVPLAVQIRSLAKIPTAAVGLVTDPHQANAIVQAGEADFVVLGRQVLRDPYWPLHAAHELGVDVSWPAQYLAARPPSKKSS